MPSCGDCQKVAKLKSGRSRAGEREEPSSAPAAAHHGDHDEQNKPSPRLKKMLNIDLDREWTRTVASHVQTCRQPLEFLYSEQDGFSLTDFYGCPACQEVLAKEPSTQIDLEGERALVRHSILKKAALGIPIEDINEQDIVTSADEAEIAATLEEDFKSKFMDVAVDREWTRAVSEHVIKCGSSASSLNFESARQDGFELVDFYGCQNCGETLCKRASLDLENVSCRSGLLRIELNCTMLKPLAKVPPTTTVQQLYHMWQLSGMVCPTLEQITELVAQLKRDLDGESNQDDSN